MIANTTIQYKINQKINYKLLEGIVEQMKVMAHPVRLAIVIILAVNKKMTVSQIYDELGIQQSVASNHLKLMKTHNLLISRRQGKYIYYSVNAGTLRKLYSTMKVDFYVNE
ncbi:MAG TPA: metalloregulator ArsR/SmtB family transcription factor [Bacteroidales bacterium]|nr:metalloregulator ArsR/SmtB family transcription factor [Bacteroidales bacterium]